MAHKSHKLFLFYDLAMIFNFPYMTRFMVGKFPLFFFFFMEKLIIYE